MAAEMPKAVNEHGTIKVNVKTFKLEDATEFTDGGDKSVQANG